MKRTSLPGYRIGRLAFALGWLMAFPGEPLAADPASPDRAVPGRIAVRPDDRGRGEFFDTASGRSLFWRGSNHCRFTRYPDDRTFTSLYDPGETEAMFRKMRGAGYNVVRVFLRQGGIAAADGKAALDEGYMRNVVDFIRRGAAHGVSTYLTVDWPPEAFARVAGPSPGEQDPPIRGTNLHYFSPRYLRAYGLFWHQVLSRIRAEDPRLLAAIAAVDLKNEIAFDWSEPFSRSEGTIHFPDLGSFDLASPAERKKLADRAAARWVREVRARVREVDPEILVTASAWFPQEPDTLGHGRVWQIPFDPAAIQGECDFLDLHVYAAKGGGLCEGYASWGGDRHAGRLRAEKPVVIGELGVFRDAVGEDLGKAMWILADFQHGSYHRLNARGWLHWLWDNRGFERFWSDEWLIDRSPENWIGPDVRPDPAMPPSPPARTGAPEFP